MVRLVSVILCGLFSLTVFASAALGGVPDPTSPETVIRTLVHANAEKDMTTLSRLMAHDADITSYSIGGRKYVGWPEFEREMREEFINVHKLEIPNGIESLDQRERGLVHDGT